MIDKIQQDIITAMKAKDQVRLGTLRMILSELRNASIELRASGKELDNVESLKVIAKEAKKRKESIAIFEQSGREDLAVSERAELAIIEEYLPVQMSEDEVRTAVEAILADTADSNFGMVMRTVMEKLKGKADGSVVTKIVKEILARKS